MVPSLLQKNVAEAKCLFADTGMDDYLMPLNVHTAVRMYEVNTEITKE